MLPVSVRHLPIVDVIDPIKTSLAQGDELVLEAPPGAGKTTVIPLALLNQSWLKGQKILMLEPRRLAARNAAQRMAELLGEQVGETVGYRMRFDSRVSHSTRIEVITEGILIRLLQNDPSLEGVGLVIFDEFHERSLDADLGLALTLYGRQLFGDLREAPLKLLVMSATLEGSRVSDLLGGAPVIQSMGKAYPVEIHYSEPYRHDQNIQERVGYRVLQALEEQSGSLLVFLPGQGEIRKVAQFLNDRLSPVKDIHVTPLFGHLSIEAQREAVQKPLPGHRKIVLATNIAETSLTIEGVSVVIDSGLCREPEFDPRSGMTRLVTRRISRASAIQRTGRAGRTQAGTCYRLWSEKQNDEQAQYNTPEIVKADLLPLTLQLFAWGVSSVKELQWLDAPQLSAWNQAAQLLILLGAVTPGEDEAKNTERTHDKESSHRYKITAHGELMAALPVHPRLAHMILMAEKWGCQDIAIDLAVALSERELVQSQSVDIQLCLDALRKPPSTVSKALIQRVKKQRQQLRQACDQLTFKKGSQGESLFDKKEFLTLDEAEKVGLVLATAYPDRIAKQHASKDQYYQLSNGRAASCSSRGGMFSSWMVVADMGGISGQKYDRIYLAASVSIEHLKIFLPELLQTKSIVEWDTKDDRFVSESRVVIGQVIVESRVVNDVDPDLRIKAMTQVVRAKGLDVFSMTPECMQWRNRVQLMRRLDSHNSGSSLWPDVSDQGLLNTLEAWFEPLLMGAKGGQFKKLDDFKQLDVFKAFKNLLNWPLPAELDEQLPLRVKAPSGSLVALDYSVTPPVLAVKLQEMFGCTQTPTLASGRQAVMLHLLSPAGRPLQVTQDLEGFWQGGYEAVKKEMKGRYPKHPWPDDPLQAIATAKTKRHLS